MGSLIAIQDSFCKRTLGLTSSDHTNTPGEGPRGAALCGEFGGATLLLNSI